MEPMITVKKMVCVTYQANSALLPYHFIGDTEEEARTKMNDWLNKKNTPSSQENDVEETEIPQQISGRGIANTGKIWMINHTLKVRERVFPNDVANFLAKGYEHGGPRTQFRS